MSNAIFPKLPGIKWGMVKTPVWSTRIQKSASGRELRASYFSYPMWKFSLSFDVLRTRGGLHELEMLAGFFNARRGSFDSFLFEDDTDNTVSNQIIGTVIAGKTKYQLIRTFGGFAEPVLAVKDNPVIQVGGTNKIAGTDYDIADNGVLVFKTALVAGQEIAWSGQFYFRVRFLQDDASFENVLSHLWAAKKIEFQTVKL